MFEEYFDYLTSLETDVEYKVLQNIFIAALTSDDLKNESLGILDAIF